MDFLLVLIDFFRVVTIHAFDGRTDRRTPFSSLVSARIPCSAEKIERTVLQMFSLTLITNNVDAVY